MTDLMVVGVPVADLLMVGVPRGVAASEPEEPLLVVERRLSFSDVDDSDVNLLAGPGLILQWGEMKCSRPLIHETLMITQISYMHTASHSIMYSCLPGYLSWVDLDLGSSPGWWAATVATCCPSRTVEHPKSKSTQARYSTTGVTLFSAPGFEVR